MANALCAKIEGNHYALGAVGLAGMDGVRHTGFLRQLEQVGEARGGIEGLSSGNVYCVYSIANIFGGKVHRLKVLLVVLVTTHTAEYERDGNGRLSLALDGGFYHLALRKAFVTVLLRSIAEFGIYVAQVLQFLCQNLYALGYTFFSLKEGIREVELLEILVEVTAALFHLQLLTQFVVGHVEGDALNVSQLTHGGN